LSIQAVPVLSRSRIIALAALVLSIAFLHCPARAVQVFAQNDRTLDATFMIQFWNVTTFDAHNLDGDKVADRSDFYIRRGRFGIKGKFNEDVSYCFTFAYDNVGKDAMTSSTGTPQDSSNKEYYLWDGFCTVTLQPSWANLTVGYFRPQVGRESITSAFNVDSFTKGLPNSYLRPHLVGRSNGRETGINVGGLNHSGRWGLNYNFGLFDTNHDKIAGYGGYDWAPLLAGRVAVTIGDSEMKTYGLNYKVNYFDQRRGVTMALNGTWQGQTNQNISEDLGGYLGGFKNNALAGADILANYGPLSLTAELDVLHREFLRDAFGLFSGAPGPEYTDHVWLLRAGYDMPLAGNRFLEPVVMWTRFEGDRLSAFYPGGEDEVLSLGLNWYLDGNDWKVVLHYVWQDGHPVSQYSSRSDSKGDFLGLGMQMVY
jgi:hypothetical protein